MQTAPSLHSPVHPSPPIVAATDWPDPRPFIPSLPLDDAGMLRAAGHFGRHLPALVHDALVDFVDHAPDAGALVLPNVPLGTIARTPASPIDPADKDRVSEFMLLAVARRLGQPVGYLPELGGRIVQNVVPVRTSAARQVSTSSKVQLMFHTEAAFHPHRPRYLALACLRGDPAAATTLSSILAIQDHLPRDVRTTLFEPRFRTAVDESYLRGRANELSAPMAVLSGKWERPRMVFDADLMVGTDLAAEHALRVLADTVAQHQTAVVLTAGDLLIVDNQLAVNGRSPFAPRFDGTDRWLQRSFVVTDLGAIGSDLDGRVVTTTFGAA